MIRKLTLLTLSLALLLTACQTASDSAAALEASGVVEAVDIAVSAEVPGLVAEVFVDEGQPVQAGDPLLRLENDLLQAQIAQAQAGLEAAQAALETARLNHDLAQAGLETAQAGREAAQAQYDLALLAARAEEQALRLARWSEAPLTSFNLPNWYFTTDEQVAAAEAEVQAAREAWQAEEDNYQSVLQTIGEQEVQQAETRLNQAYAAFRVADGLRQRAIDNGQRLDDYVQNLYDAARTELDAAQRNYDQVLTANDRADLLDARARRDAARERYETALDALNALQTGLRSPQLRAAEAALAQAEAQVKQAEIGVQQAEAAITQAEKGAAQAQAALDALRVQQDKLTLRAPQDGVVTVRSVEQGELVQPGLPLLTLSRLDALTVTVYIPENRYGEIHLGQQAELRVDSFPNETFTAVVIWIADQAEYTPRNVQTKEERVTTVYAVKLRIENGGDRLKPGMPADVRLGQP